MENTKKTTLRLGLSLAVLISLNPAQARIAHPVPATQHSFRTEESARCENSLGVLDPRQAPLPVSTERIKTSWADYDSIADFFEAHYRPEDLYSEAELKSVRRFQKMAPWIDRGLVIITAPVWVPIAGAAALITRIDSPGPVLFLQERVGQGGKPFKIYKLRTMNASRSERDEVVTRETDTRITRFGKIARRWKLDELFQLLNVLKGDMSLVGPRPIVPPEFRSRSEESPAYPYRLLLKPGLTGWGQVHLEYSESERRYIQPLSRELYEVKNLSFKMYVKTILKTITTVLNGQVSH